VRMGSHAAVRRLEPGVFEITANTDVEISLPGGKIHKLSAGEMAKHGGVVTIRTR